jgi:hypothetical protein
MRRTSLVLAVVAAMVTVLVFAAPAFGTHDLPHPSDNPLDNVHCPGAGDIVAPIATSTPAPGKTLLEVGEESPETDDDTPGEVVQTGQDLCKSR